MQGGPLQVDAPATVRSGTGELSARAGGGLAWSRRVEASEPFRYGTLALFTIITRLPLLTYPKACDDEQVYAVVAMEMLRGGRPYIDAVERKPPLLFYLYEALFAVGGAYDYLLLHLAALAWTLATMAGLYALVRRLFDPLAGYVAALLYAVFMAWADYTNLALNGELLMNFPVVLAFAIAFRRSRSTLRLELLASGSLIALAFLLKQPAVAAGLPLALYVVHTEYRRSRAIGWVASSLHAAWLALGFALTLLGAAWMLQREGILAEAWYWTISNHKNPLGPTTWFFWQPLPLTGLFFAAETAPLWMAALFSVRKRANGGLWRGRGAELAALLLLLAVSSIGVAANGQFTFHYFLALMPPLALIAAPWLAGLWRGDQPPPHPVLRPAVWAGAVGLAAVGFLTVDTIGLWRNRLPHPSAVYVREHSTESDRFFMWGQGTAETGLYLDARRRPASRYIASFPLNGIIFGLSDPDFDLSGHVVPGAWDNLRRDFARHPPKFIVDCHAMRGGQLYKIRDYPYLRDLLATEYREVFRAWDGIVYERQTAHTGDPPPRAQ